MSARSPIEWTEATWNPIVGCSIVSPGCTNCYAMRDAWRKHHNPLIPHYHGLTQKVKDNPVWTGKLARAPESTFLAPLKRKKPTIYFVNSMGDLFHEDVPDHWIDEVFAIMALCPQHTFQVLTKRSTRMRDYIGAISAPLGRQTEIRRAIEAYSPWPSDHLCGGHIETTKAIARVSGAIGKGWNPLPNVWLGVSAERQAEADERIPALLQTPAAVRFVSAEPLLGPIDLRCVPNDFPGEIEDWPRLRWVIVGGESGPHARPMHPDWARSLRDQCAAAGVPFFFKQWGRFAPVDPHKGIYISVCRDGRVREWQPDFPSSRLIDLDMAPMVPVGKKAAGRLLDGVEHNAMPEISR